MCQHIYSSYNNIYFLGKKLISSGVQMELKILYIICINLAYLCTERLWYHTIFVHFNWGQWQVLFINQIIKSWRVFADSELSAELSVYTCSEDLLHGILYLQSNSNHIQDVCNETQNHVKLSWYCVSLQLPNINEVHQKVC